MEFLILEIIKKMEEIASKANDGLINNRESITIDPDNHNDETGQIRKNNNGCCH